MTSANPRLDGPCFQPDFVSGIATYIDGCKVAILGPQSDPAGFWPFRMTGNQKAAAPIPMCDYQAIIGLPSARWDVRELLRDAGLRAWSFENLIASQVPVEHARRLSLSRSPRATLQQGFSPYVEKQTKAGRSTQKVRDTLRLLKRDHGEVTFIQNTHDERALDQLLHWKAQRFAVGGDFPAWVPNTLKHFFQLQQGPLVAVLSLLKAGDRVVASHFGLKVGPLLYYWFPAFDPAFAKYTPGRLLLWHLLEHLDDVGCVTLDFGPGGEAYKAHFANDSIEIGTGIVDASAYAASLKWAADEAANTLRRIVGKTWLKHPLVLLRNNYRRISRYFGT